GGGAPDAAQRHRASWRAPHRGGRGNIGPAGGSCLVFLCSGNLAHEALRGHSGLAVRRIRNTQCNTLYHPKSGAANSRRNDLRDRILGHRDHTDARHRDRSYPTPWRPELTSTSRFWISKCKAVLTPRCFYEWVVDGTSVMRR